jgi:ubiquinone/menaquinone biosynthesis C-methylase UbiE
LAEIDSSQLIRIYNNFVLNVFSRILANDPLASEYRAILESISRSLKIKELDKEIKRQQEFTKLAMNCVKAISIGTAVLLLAIFSPDCECNESDTADTETPDTTE